MSFIDPSILKNEVEEAKSSFDDSFATLCLEENRSDRNISICLFNIRCLQNKLDTLHTVLAEKPSYLCH